MSGYGRVRLRNAFNDFVSELERRAWSNERRNAEVYQEMARRGRAAIAAEDALAPDSDETAALRARVETAEATAHAVTDLLTESRARVAELEGALRGVVSEADLMLAGGESAMRHAEQCADCGLGGVGPLRDALTQARAALATPGRATGGGR